MDSFLNFLFHPATLAILCLLLLVLMYYLVKTFFRIVVIAILVIFFGLAGYHYYRAEGNFNQRLRTSLLETKGQVGGWIDHGKAWLYWGKKKINEHRQHEETKDQKV